MFKFRNAVCYPCVVSILGTGSGWRRANEEVVLSTEVIREEARQHVMPGRLGRLRKGA